MLGMPVGRDEELRQFPVLDETARRFLELGEEWKSWVLCDWLVPDWVDGPVVLPGDAAHPMPQYAAQGGCEALEDAVLLGDLLDRVGVDFGD